jgi:hypothetical protein
LTRAYLGLAALDVLELGAGYGLLYGLGFVRSGRGALRSLGLAFFTGWAALGVALAIGISLGLDPDVPRTLGVAFAIAIAGIACRGFRGPVAMPPARSSTHPAARALAISGAAVLGIALASAFVAGAASPADTNWDVWAFWVPKAEAIYYFHGLDTGLGGYLTYAHANYPPLTPATTAATFHLMGGVHPSLLPLQQCLVGVAFITSIVLLLRQRVPDWLLFPTLAMLVLAPEFWTRIPVVLPDQSTGYLLAAAAVLCVLWILERRNILLAPAVVFLGAAAMTKSEGFLLGLLLALLTSAAALARYRTRVTPALALLLGPAAVLPWFHWLTTHDRSLSAGDYDWHKVFDPSYLSARTDRLHLAVGQLAHFALAFGFWSLVAPLVLLACVLAVRTAPAVAAVIALWLTLAFAGLVTTYWIGVPEIHWYIATSAERVVATLPLVAGTLLPLLLSIPLAEPRSGA